MTEAITASNPFDAVKMAHINELKDAYFRKYKWEYSGVDLRDTLQGKLVLKGRCVGRTITNYVCGECSVGTLNKPTPNIV
jgi:hypothetical protein